MFTGTLAFTTCCTASPVEVAPWPVEACWPSHWDCPGPPPPHAQAPPVPVVWDWGLAWLVFAVLPAFELAPLVEVCAAGLPPLWMLPPAVFSGALLFTAFCGAFAVDVAACPVSACWLLDWDC